MTHLAYQAIAFGLHWRSDIALEGFDPADASAVGYAGSFAPPIDVYRVDRVADRAGLHPVYSGFLYADGIRFTWEREVVFDMTDGTAITYHPGSDWTGTIPNSFYSTVAALTVAWRGLVPLHACAVEVDGKAVLIAGTTGAGKSTLTAELLGLGARFVADDLVVVSVADDRRISIPRGRPTIRLHPDTASSLDTVRSEPVIGDPRGKWLAQPRRRYDGAPLELGAIVILDDDAPLADTAPAVRLLAHVFRRRLLLALPMRASLIGDVLAIATRTPMLVYPPQTDSTGPARRQRAEDVMARIRTKLDLSTWT